MKGELNHFSSLALNIFKVSHSTDIYSISFLVLFQQQGEFLNITFSWYHFPITKDGIFNCSNTFERVLSTCVFFHYTYIHTHFL